MINLPSVPWVTTCPKRVLAATLLCPDQRHTKRKRNWRRSKSIVQGVNVAGGQVCWDAVIVYGWRPVCIRNGLSCPRQFVTRNYRSVQWELFHVSSMQCSDVSLFVEFEIVGVTVDFFTRQLVKCLVLACHGNSRPSSKVATSCPIETRLCDSRFHCCGMRHQLRRQKKHQGS